MSKEKLDFEFTGERFIPTIKGQIRYEHLHRYASCTELVAGKDVLDIACGEGYGSALLSKSAHSVIGVDIDSQIVQHAKIKYGNQSNLQFRVVTSDAIPLDDASVDVVISFETFEDLDKHEEMWREIKRVLRPEGILIISTPDKRTYSDPTGYSNKFRAKELYLHEFEQLLKKYFRYVTLHGQRLATVSFINMSGTNLCTFDTYDAWSVEQELIKKQVAIPPDPVYVLAACSDKSPLQLRASVFINPNDDLYMEHVKIAHLAQDLNQALAEKDALITAVLSSHSWRFTKPCRFIGRIMRGEWAMVFASLRPIIDASMSRLARLLVSVYSSSGLMRYCYAMSNKLVRPLFPKLHDKIFVDFKLYLKQRLLIGSRGSDNAMLMQLYSLPKPTQEKFYPKVSVIVPNYNHSRYLSQRLEPIYRQTYKNIEVILLDDNSTDESIQILEEYQQRYPNITRCYFNDKNSGSVFYQWKRGIELAQGELIWIAESDDYCSENMLEELVKFFANEAVMLAFCRTVFVDDDTSQQIWSLEEYLADLADPVLWSQPFIKSAHRLVNTLWGIKNIIPNVSSAVFRNPGKLELLEDKNWGKMRICGDWIFHLHLIRGGLVAYTPNATNFYRMHKKNISVSTYKQDIYYREHEKVAKELVKLYRLQEGIIEKQRFVLELHWRIHRADYSESDFKKCYDYERVKHLSKSYKPNLLMVTYALTSGGGETFPIRLSNLLKSAGYSVTLLNCHREPTQPGVRKMLRQDVPLLELDGLDRLNAVVDDMGIEIVHSHHAWVDVTLCSLLKNNPNCKVVVTTHGMYEMMSHAELDRVVPLLNKRVNKFVYIADKNLSAFDLSIIDKNRFAKICNAIERVPITPFPREEISINKDDFVLCIVSRAIPEKGWEEGIEAVTLARKLSGKDIHLLLIGEGPEYERLRRKVRDHFIHFLGFRANVLDYFATSNLGFLPSRFHGESYPLVVIECLQANRPVLASDIGETSRMIETESGPAGSVFTLDNWKLPVKRMAELIAEYATNRNLYSEHLRRVPEAIKKFDPEKMLHSYELVYQEVLGDNSK